MWAGSGNGNELNRMHLLERGLSVGGSMSSLPRLSLLTRSLRLYLGPAVASGITLKTFAGLSGVVFIGPGCPAFGVVASFSPSDESS